MQLYLFTEPDELQEDHVYLLMDKGDQLELVNKFIYKSGKGRYIRVRKASNQHVRVYLKEIEKYDGQLQGKNQGEQEER